MKKQFLILIVAFIPAASFARVADFNTLITENTKAQSELHETVSGQLGSSRADVASEKKPGRVVVVENGREMINSPTKEGFLAAKKEKNFKRVSEKKQFERLAHEISSQAE